VLSVEKMWFTRNELFNPRLITDADNVSETVNRYAKNYHREYVFIDTPSSMMHTITDALKAADLVVVPTQISQLDQWAQDAVLDRINRIWPPSKLAFVLTRVDQRNDTPAEIKEAKRYLQQFTPHPIAIMGNRKDYRLAAGLGKAGWEIGKNERRKRHKRGSGLRAPHVNPLKSEIGEIWKVLQVALNASSVEQSNVVSIAR
jgi:cellulose biosynthesis protein BcsQ